MRSPRTAMKSGPHSPQLEKACAQQRRPSTAKNLKNQINKLIKKKPQPHPGVRSSDETGLGDALFSSLPGWASQALGPAEILV